MNQTILVGKVSFDADSNHRLQDGVKVSLDLIVDQANELYASLPGAGSSKEYPFVQINIKHLNLQDGTGENLLPVDKYNYKDNLQFQVYQDIQINGLSLLDNPVYSIQLGLYGTLDLENAIGNKTEIRLYGNTYASKKYFPDVYENKDYEKTRNANFFDFIYKDNKVSIAANGLSTIVGALEMGVFPYDMLLAKPIGNFVDTLLPAEQREAFDALYWSEKPEKDEKGTITKEGTWNKDFKGLVIDNFTFNDLLGLIMPKEQEQTPATSSAEEKKGNIYNTIVYAFTLLSTDENAQLALKANDVAGLVADIVKLNSGAEWTNESMGASIKGLLDEMGYGVVGGLLGFNGMSKAEAGEKFIDLITDVKFDGAFNFTEGINWKIDIIREEDEKLEVARKKAYGKDDEYTTFRVNTPDYDDLVISWMNVDNKANPTTLKVMHKPATFGKDVIQEFKLSDMQTETITVSQKEISGVYKLELLNYSQQVSEPFEQNEKKSTIYVQFAEDATTYEDIINVYSDSYGNGNYRLNTALYYSTMEDLGTNIVWTSHIGFSENDYLEEYNRTDLPNEIEQYLKNRKAYFNGIDAAKEAQTKAQSAYDEADKAYKEADQAYKNTELYKAIATATTNKKNAQTAWNAAAIKKNKDYGSAYTAGKLGAFIQKYENAYKAYINGGSPSSGDLKETLEQTLSDVTKKIEELVEAGNTTVSDEWTAAKTLLETYRNKEKAETDAIAKAQAQTEYTTLQTATTEQTNKQTALTAANKAVSDLETPLNGWFYWDFATKPADPTPEA